MSSAGRDGKQCSNAGKGELLGKGELFIGRLRCAPNQFSLGSLSVLLGFSPLPIPVNPPVSRYFKHQTNNGCLVCPWNDNKPNTHCVGCVYE